MMLLRRFYSRRPVRIDPGIARQRGLFPDTKETEMEDFDFEDFEADFTDAHKSHRQHVEDMKLTREREKYLIVRQKYFKEKWPNFLTWQDKEQIRYLHHQDPEEWTVERLSEGFPALPDVIKKIIKGKWSKGNEQKIINHDRKVQENWAKFKQNDMHDLAPDLKKHLAKFTERQTQTAMQPALSLSKNIVKPKKGGDFSEIILSYQRLQNKKNQAKTEHQIESYSNKIKVSDEFSQEPICKSNQKSVTLKELQRSVKEKASQGKNVSVQEKLMLDQIETGSNSVESVSQADLSQKDLSRIMQTRYNINQEKKVVGFVQKTSKDMSHLIYPEKITIPPDIYKRGYTYKLNDCYYNSDGYFLYRVPGMI